MASKSTIYNFFATADDLRSVLRSVEASHRLQYVQCGLFEERDQPIFHGFSSLPALGVAKAGDSNLEPTFLVFPDGAKLEVRAVPQRRGGIKYAVDQMVNPGTVVIRPGGKYLDSALIAGMVGTVHHDKQAETLIRAFSASLKRDFTTVKSYVVGSEARKMLASGVRLTKSLHASREFDLSVKGPSV